MPRGASAKREREYDELKQRFEKEGRYKGREEEVASRIVNKQRAMFGETNSEKAKDRAGKSPDRGLPIRNFQHETVRTVRSKLRHLSPGELKRVEAHEKTHLKRKSMLEEIQRAKKR